MRDLLYACRMLLKRPGFTLVAVATLALGIGVNCAIFSVVDTVMLRSLPFTDPGRLVSVWPNRTFSKQELLFLRDSSRAYSKLGLYVGGESFSLTGRDQPLEVLGARSTADLFAMLGVKAAIGRSFAPGDDQPGNDRVVLLSDGLWRRLFAASPAALGQRLELNGQRYTVIGVMPAGFQLLDNGTELWLPATLDPQGADFKAQFADLLGRLRPGWSARAAGSELAALVPRMRQRFEERDEEPGAPRVASLRERVTGGFERTVFLLSAAVIFVLLVACANVAHLQLARTVERYKEIAIRTALGARPRQVARQILTESALLAVVGGACGLLLAYWAVSLLVANLPPETPRLGEIAVDGRVVAFSLLLALLAGVASGLVPALRSLETDLQPALKEGGRSTTAGPRRHRLAQVLVALQVGLALVLAVGAGLMVRSLWRLQQVDPGFRPENLLTLRVNLPSSRYAKLQQITAFYDQVLDRIQRLPGVVAIGAAQSRPLGGEIWNADLTVKGRPAGAQAPPLNVDWIVVTPGYFQTLVVPLLAGRVFAATDRLGTQAVAVVNQTLARRVWPGESPLGKQVYTALEGENHWVTVVGVVGDVKHHGQAAAAMPALYRPHAQFDRYPRAAMTLLVRTVSAPLRLAADARSRVWTVDRDVPVSQIQTMESVLYESIGGPRLIMRLLAVFAGLALLLGAISIYGIVSYSVSQRVHEIGLRMALGARRRDVLGLVVGQAMQLILIGLGAGLAAALALTRLLQAQLFEIGSADPATFCAVSLVLLAVGLLASALPAYRASRSDPLVALQYE
ncbi:MAG TPA: ABC transporter permease [Thermoanaerobaculia bacterium]